jgi:predicted dehydrogenase
MTDGSNQTRRDFIKSSSLALAGATAVEGFPFVSKARAATSGSTRVGVIGCGGRGTGAVLNVLQAATKVIYPKTGYHTEDAAAGASRAAENVEVVALADLFPDRLAQCREQLSKVEVQVADDLCFSGFDAYEKLLAVEEVDYVIHATPPHFRPQHLMAAVEAGKHVFIEKPAAVDGAGVRTVLEAGKLAKKKGLGIVAGTQRRHDLAYVETMKRIHDGAIGKLHTCRAYWNGGVIWTIPRQEGWSDMEWQVRNWCHFTWLSGDHIVEQHLHSLDVANWVLGAHPLKALALGGRQARFGEIFGDAYDHFAVEYEYPAGVKMFSQCRQIDGCENRVETSVEGSAGSAKCDGTLRDEAGQVVWRFRDPNAPNPYEQEHLDLLDSIRKGEPLNEAQAVAEATLTGIMGRESAFSGRSITWEEALDSKQHLGPKTYAFGDLPFPEVPIPGKYTFV